MSEEIVPAAPPLVPLEPTYPPCWVNAANLPVLPPPTPFTVYELGEILKEYMPPVFLTVPDPPLNGGRLLFPRRAKKVSPLTIIAFKLLQKLPEMRRDEKGNLVPAGVALNL